jgi:hypothetical protein
MRLWRRAVRPAPVLLLLLTLAACAGPPERAAAADDAVTVYVVRRGWHTDIGFAAADLQGGPLQSVAADFPGARYLVFGFGDRRYLLSRGRDLGDELLALWPGTGLILASGIRLTPQQAFGAGGVVELPLPRQGAAAIAAYVRASLQADAGGAVRSLAPGPYADSLFYASGVRYSGFHTCNTWTAQALQAGQVPVSSSGVVFAWQLWPQVREQRDHP